MRLARIDYGAVASVRRERWLLSLFVTQRLQQWHAFFSFLICVHNWCTLSPDPEGWWLGWLPRMDSAISDWTGTGWISLARFFFTTTVVALKYDLWNIFIWWVWFGHHAGLKLQFVLRGNENRFTATIGSMGTVGATGQRLDHRLLQMRVWHSYSDLVLMRMNEIHTKIEN